MDELLVQLLDLMQYAEQNADEFSPEEMTEISSIFEEVLGFIEETQQPQGPPTQVPIPEGADQMWILAGGDPAAFTNYLRTAPNPALNALANDPEQLQSVIDRLGSQITVPHGEVEDTIPRANLQSSNVYGYSYRPRDNTMFVRFNSGSVYEYENVPPGVFKAFQRFAIPAKTSGSNQWGRWWQGKSPSIGATFHEMIRDNFPYQRVA